ncbi:MAG: hypothetical protein QW267_07285 [Sulfolobales archaeon]
MGFAIASETGIGGKKAVTRKITPAGYGLLERRRDALNIFEKKAMRIKLRRLHELMARLRLFFVGINKMNEDDIEKLRRAVEKFLEDTKPMEMWGWAM